MRCLPGIPPRDDRRAGWLADWLYPRQWLARRDFPGIRFGSKHGCSMPLLFDYTDTGQRGPLISRRVGATPSSGRPILTTAAVFVVPDTGRTKYHRHAWNVARSGVRRRRAYKVSCCIADIPSSLLDTLPRRPRLNTTGIGCKPRNDCCGCDVGARRHLSRKFGLTFPLHHTSIWLC